MSLHEILPILRALRSWAEFNDEQWRDEEVARITRALVTRTYLELKSGRIKLFFDFRGEHLTIQKSRDCPYPFHRVQERLANAVPHVEVPD